MSSIPIDALAESHDYELQLRTGRIVLATFDEMRGGGRGLLWLHLRISPGRRMLVNARAVRLITPAPERLDLTALERGQIYLLDCELFAQPVRTMFDELQTDERGLRAVFRDSHARRYEVWAQEIRSVRRVASSKDQGASEKSGQ